MTLGDYMNQLAVSAGVASDDADLKTFLSSPSIMGAEFPKTVADKISSGLMTMDAARNNPNLHKHFFGLMAAQADEMLVETMKKHGVPDELATSIKSIDGVHKKWVALADKIKELEEAKLSANKPDKKEIEKQIADLNNQIIAEKQRATEAVTAERSQWSGRMQNQALQIMLSGYKYGLPKEIPANVVIDTAKGLIQNKIQEQKLKLDFNPDTSQYKLLTESGTEYYKDNTPVSFKSFVDQVLADNKLLETAAPITPPSNQPPTVPVGGSTVPGLSDALAELNAMLPQGL